MLRCLLLLFCLAGACIATEDDPADQSDPDPPLTEARHAATNSAETLDGFLCDKHIARYHRDSPGAPWRKRDTIDAELAFDRGTGERYRDIRLNGVPTDANMFNLGGSNSIGEFALDLANLFASIGNDSFHFLGVETRNGKRIRTYSYAVEQSASNWKIDEDSQFVRPAYGGVIAIDVESGQVVRLEMHACNLPFSFPAALVSVAVDYGPLTIASQKPRRLPLDAEALYCSRRGVCDRNVIHFDNYRQFTVESTLAFTPLPALAPVLIPPPAAASVPAPSDRESLQFFGIAHPQPGGALTLELDDERFLIVDLRSPAAPPLREGDRIQVSTQEYDGRGLVADFIDAIDHARTPPSTQSVSVEQPAAPAGSFIERARRTEADLLRNLPNYLCTEEVARYRKWPATRRWQLLDRLSTDVLYRRQFGETYHNVRIDGQPTSRQWVDIGGDVSTGEFGTMLRSLLAEGTAGFHFLKDTRLNGLLAAEYSFTVPRARSDWHIRVDYQFIVPAYSGTVWLDRNLGRVLRIERQADGIPSAFPLRSVSDKVTFGDVPLRPSQTDLLPIHAETELCTRKSKICSRKLLRFTNYRLFTADSKLKF